MILPRPPSGRLRRPSPGTQAFTATTRIEINHHGNRYPLKVAVMMKRPAFLRVESIPLMGPPDFYLSIAEGELRVFLPGKGAFYTGRATPRNISRFFPVSMPAADMISLLMGVPPEDAEEMQSLGGRTGRRALPCRSVPVGKEDALPVDRSGGRTAHPVPEVHGRGNGIVYTADFADHVRIGEGFLPQQVTIRDGGNGHSDHPLHGSPADRRRSGILSAADPGGDHPDSPRSLRDEPVMII